MAAAVQSNGNGSSKFSIKIQPWAISIFIFLGAQTGTGIWWASSITSEVKHVVGLETKFTDVVRRVDNALVMFKNQAGEIQDLHKNVATLNGVDDQLRNNIATLANNYFSLTDWQTAQKMLDNQRAADNKFFDLRIKQYCEKIKELEQRIKELEKKQ